MRYRLDQRFFRKWLWLILLCALLADGLLLAVNFISERLAQTPQVAALLSQNDHTRQLLAGAGAAIKRLNAELSTATDLSTIADLRIRREDLVAQYIALDAELQAGRAELEPLLPAPLPVGSSGLLLVGAAVLGAGLGTGIAYVVEYRDGVFRSRRSVRDALGIPVLAVFPAIRSDAAGDKLISLAAMESFASPYHELAALLVNADGPQHRSCLVTSAGSDEGKSLTAANLSIALAAAGKQTLLIDADLRTPTQHKLFKLGNREGLVNAFHEFSLMREQDTEPEPSELPFSLTRHLRISETPNLSILTTGPLPSEPHEVFGALSFPSLLEAFCRQFDMIIIDTPPILAIPDALPIAACVDGVLLVIDSRRTRRRVGLQLARLLRDANAHVVGAVLNRVRTSGTTSL